MEFSPIFLPTLALSFVFAFSFLNRMEDLKPYLDAHIPTKVITDSAVGVIMEEVDLCLVGGEGVWKMVGL